MFGKPFALLSVLGVLCDPCMLQVGGDWADPSCELDALSDFLQCSQDIQRCTSLCPYDSIPGLGGTAKDVCNQISSIPGISNVDIVNNCCLNILAQERVLDFNKGANCETLLKIQNCVLPSIPGGSVVCSLG